tara:strand:+ start:301 stop:810 length:510 start_codon:yes stop_codon:yes gene_type:complete
MPKILPKEMKQKAQKLYLEGKTINEVYEELLKTYPKENIAKSTVYSWPSRNKWDEDMQEIDSKVAKKVKDSVVETQSQRAARTQLEHLDEYTTLRSKALAELGVLDFKTAEGAAKALDMGIQGERKVMEGLINLSFVQDIVGVLVDEIEDKELLKKISIKLQGVLKEHE